MPVDAKNKEQIIAELYAEEVERVERSFKNSIREKLKQIAAMQKVISNHQESLENMKKQLHELKMEEPEFKSEI